MLTLEEIAALVGPWFSQGRIRQGDYELLKTQYLAEIGAAPTGCTTCQSFRSDVLHHFRYQLRQNQIPTMETNRKYILADEVHSLSLPDDQRLIVNEAGDDEENRRPLTDELAEALFEKDEAYRQFIIPNPGYKAPEKTAPAATKPAANVPKPKPAAPKAPTAPAKPAATPPKPATTEPGTQLGLETGEKDIENAQKAADDAQKSTGSSPDELKADQQ